MEDKRNNEAQRPLTRNTKRHILLVSLLLWRKMVAIRCFIWALALRLWSVRQWVRWSFGNFIKSLYLEKLYLILDGIILLHKGDLVVEYVSAMVFGGDILGDACKIWGNPYLYSMTVQFVFNCFNYTPAYFSNLLWSLYSSWKFPILYALWWHFFAKLLTGEPMYKESITMHPIVIEVITDYGFKQ